MNKIVLVAFFAFLAVSTAIPLREFLFRTASPSSWILEDRADPRSRTSFHIALQQRNIDTLKKWLELDSDPDSPLFAQHKTQDEILSLIEPSQEVQQKVLNWISRAASRFAKADVHVENLRDAIEVKASVAFVEELFQTELYTFVHAKTGHRVTKHLYSLHLPEDVVEHVQLVTGITEFPPEPLASLKKEQPKKQKRQAADNQCNVPYNMKSMYDWPQDLYVTQPGANITIFASLGGQISTDGFGEPDALFFQQANALPSNPVKCIIGDAASSYTTNYTDGEAQLDVQLSTTMAPKINLCFYITEAWMYEFSLFLFNTPGTPVVASMSYAWFENQQCFGNITGTNCPSYHIPNYQAYINRTSVEFAKLGLRGHTMVAASGDGGTAGNHGSDDNCETLGPLFPAASPYVVSVGATSIEPSTSMADTAALPPICTDQNTYQCVCTTSTNEQIATAENTAQFDTGGGFSSVEAQPAWQAKAVAEYLKSGVTFPAPSLWNPANRAYPDIGAVGENICLLTVGGNCPSGLEAGTSASTPIIASMISLLNNDRLANGKKTLGFFTPLIYKMFGLNRNLYFRSNFTSVSNPGGCDGNGFFSNPKGGWSPLVGVGSPHFAAIRKYVNSLP